MDTAKKILGGLARLFGVSTTKPQQPQTLVPIEASSQESTVNRLNQAIQHINSKIKEIQVKQKVISEEIERYEAQGRTQEAGSLANRLAELKDQIQAANNRKQVLSKQKMQLQAAIMDRKLVQDMTEANDSMKCIQEAGQR